MRISDEDKKTLRRACARYYTGIRTPFHIRGKSYSFTVDSYNGLKVFLRFDHAVGRYNCEPLADVTPDSILAAIDLFEVRQVMDS